MSLVGDDPHLITSVLRMRIQLSFGGYAGLNFSSLEDFPPNVMLLIQRIKNELSVGKICQAASFFPQ